MKSKYILEISQVDINYVVGGKGLNLGDCTFPEVKEDLCSEKTGSEVWRGITHNLFVFVLGIAGGAAATAVMRLAKKRKILAAELRGYRKMA